MAKVLTQKCRSAWLENKKSPNSTFAIGGVSCSTFTFVQAESSDFRINIGGINPAHRKYAKRYGQVNNRIKQT